jgi:hypothetical protein
MHRPRTRALTSTWLILVFLAASHKTAEADQPPVVAAPSLIESAEGDSVRFDVTASDPDDDAISGLGVLQLPSGAAFDVDLAASKGTFRWLPGFTSAGSYNLSFFAENTIRGYSYTQLQIVDTDRPPVVAAPSQVSGVEGQAMTIGATASDPDGDTLLSLVAEGLPQGAQFTTNRTYTSARIDWTPRAGQGGNYNVTLIATTRPSLSPAGIDSAVISLSVAGGQFLTRVFTQGAEKSVRLGPGTGHACVHIEPRVFDVDLIIPSTVEFTWSRSGLHLFADYVSVADADRNGFKDLTACFSRADLKYFFAAVPDLPRTAQIMISGSLVGGGAFNGTVLLDPVLVHDTVFLTPNPSHGDAVLSFYTTTAARARLEIFDSRGRLMRTILDGADLPAGFHDVPVEGGASKRFPAGIYFYRLDTVDGVHQGKVLIVR